MMKIHHILLVVAAVAFISLVALQFVAMKKKEKFVMQLYRPTPVVSVPDSTWDPADVLTAALPSKDGPKLVVQKGDYRRFRRV